MNKSELIDAMCKEQLHFTERDITHLVNVIIEKMTDHLFHGHRIEIRNFGNLCLHHRAPRVAHNPRTGKRFVTESKSAIYFKAGKELKQRVNANAHLPIREASEARGA